MQYSMCHICVSQRPGEVGVRVTERKRERERECVCEGERERARERVRERARERESERERLEIQLTKSRLISMAFGNSADPARNRCKGQEETPLTEYSQRQNRCGMYMIKWLCAWSFQQILTLMMLSVSAPFEISMKLTSSF